LPLLTSKLEKVGFFSKRYESKLLPSSFAFEKPFSPDPPARAWNPLQNCLIPIRETVEAIAVPVIPATRLSDKRIKFKRLAKALAGEPCKSLAKFE